MSKIHTGGAAFPHKAKHWDSDSGCYVASLDHHEPGMSLRDYFAAAALTAIISKLPEDELAAICNGHCRAVGTPRGAYIIADAMLAARKEGA
jgi:hypothetical protein